MDLKYRRGVLIDKVAVRLEALFKQEASELDMAMHALK
jgi:hypothetical protein